MKIEFIVVGDTADSRMRALVGDYAKRIGHYLPFAVTVVRNRRPAGKPGQVTKAEGELILKKLERTDRVILLDAKGTVYDSEGFARFLGKQTHEVRRLVFVAGGAYGFAPEVYDRANGLLALSAMTFNHQMVRLIFTEQLYRALTILRNEKYHH